MLVALLLLFALSIPTTHPAAGPPVQTRTQASVELRAAEPETQAARAEFDTAYWTSVLAFATVGLAIATVLLGAITVSVTLYDRRSRQAERSADSEVRERNARRQRIDALRQMEQILWFFTRRCETLSGNSALRAETLARGFDAVMTRALDDGMARAITSQGLAEQVYFTIFDAADTLSFAIAHQASSSGHTASGEPTPSDEIAGRATAAFRGTAQAAKLVRAQRERLLAEDAGATSGGEDSP